MTREEKYASIYTHETVYCPPQEEGCAMLEVALGCSWSKCAFCDFAKDPFAVHPMEKIEENLKILGELVPEKERVFFLGENAFVLETEKLLQIIAMTKRYMPKAETFAMYARVDDVLRKSDEELKILREAGVQSLHIGVESGSDSILAMVNKGVTAFETAEAARRLDQAGIDYYFTVILGLGGKTYRNLHALETARLLNRTHPKGIWCLNLKLWSGTPLEKMARQGMFEPMTPWEMLLEERLLLQNLHVEDCFYMDTTALNLLTIEGLLPQAKEAMLASIERLLG